MKTVINGKAVELFRKNDVAVVFTKKVNELLGQGFVFNLAENTSGHQGEQMKACLTNDGGKTVYIVFVDRFTPTNYGDGLRVVVKRYDDCNGCRTLWLNEGQQLFEKKFYCINDYHSDKAVYVEEEAVYEAFYKMQENRWYARHVEYRKTLPESANLAGYRLIRKRRGFGKTALKDIESVERRGSNFVVNLTGNRSVGFGF